jgi:hypothetical protein
MINPYPQITQIIQIKRFLVLLNPCKSVKSVDRPLGEVNG